MNLNNVVTIVTNPIVMIAVAGIVGYFVTLMMAYAIAQWVGGDKWEDRVAMTYGVPAFVVGWLVRKIRDIIMSPINYRYRRLFVEYFHVSWDADYTEREAAIRREIPNLYRSVQRAEMSLQKGTSEERKSNEWWLNHCRKQYKLAVKIARKRGYKKLVTDVTTSAEAQPAPIY